MLSSLRKLGKTAVRLGPFIDNALIPSKRFSRVALNPELLSTRNSSFSRVALNSVMSGVALNAPLA